MIPCSNCGAPREPGTTCQSLRCPGTAQTRWDAATAQALALAADLDSDLEGANDDLLIRANELAAAFHAAGSTLFSVTADQSGRTAMHGARMRFIARRQGRLESEEREQREAQRLTWRRVTVGTADVTEHVAAMFDALIGSLDWGSGMLSTEDIESIMIIGALVGFDTSGATLPAEKAPDDLAPDHPGWEAVHRDPTNYNARRTAAIEAWRKQIDAKARALAGGDS